MAESIFKTKKEKCILNLLYLIREVSDKMSPVSFRGLAVAASYPVKTRTVLNFKDLKIYSRRNGCFNDRGISVDCARCTNGAVQSGADCGNSFTAEIKNQKGTDHDKLVGPV